ncbi:MAG TPA: radical SAM protein [Polyangiaceae bacterium]|nr:radical SAM protein [Polyangiaceae bacterium]
MLHRSAARADSARVVLINPPGLEGRTNERSLSGGIGVSRKLKPYEHETVEVLAIDFLYLAAVAESAGADVCLVDLLLEARRGHDALAFCADAVAAEPAAKTWVGVRLSIPSLLEDLEFANSLKTALPEACVFVFGNVILSTVEHWIVRANVDLVLYGEPEAFFERLLVAEDPARVEGVLRPEDYRPLQGDELYDEAKAAARRERWVRVSDISRLPMPAWHLLDLARYAKGGRVAELGVFVQASRGCPIGCNMCPYALLEGTTWRHNDIQRVVNEIIHLNRTYGIYRVRFRDPNFGFSRKYASALADALIAHQVELAASIEASVEVFDDETLRKLRQAGINTITTGVETNDPACMASIGQSLRVNDKLRQRIATCHTLGYHVYGTYCLGAPEETWDSVENTWRFAVELDIESGFTLLTPFPGTPMYYRALREGLLEKRMQYSSWNSYSATVQSYALSTTDLDVARWWARMEAILPYRKKRAQGALPKLRFYVRHAPHYALRGACRAYVAWRRQHSARSVPRAAAGTRANEGVKLRVEEQENN